MRTVRGETNSMENGSVGLAAYSFSGNSFGVDRFDDRQHVVKGLPGEILGALISDFARAGGRIKAGEPVRQIIKVGEIPEIAADIDRIVEQREGRGWRWPAGR